jgi:hypothetical protein
MDSEQLTVFRQTIEDLKRAAREDYERRIERLDAALAVASELGLPPQRIGAEESVGSIDEATFAGIIPPQGSIREDPSADNGSKPIVLKDEVRRAIRSWRGHAFRQRDITGIIRGRYPAVRVHAGSVSAALRKMAANGEIEVVTESRGGSEPTIYREIAVSP